MQRRDFFNLFASSFLEDANEDRSELLRPPYNKDVKHFEEKCIECDAKCVTACPEKIINICEDKTPFLDFSKSGCSYCDACALACTFDVLKMDAKHPIATKVVIDQKRCLSWSGIMCFSCKDPCLEDAIEFHAMFMPTILSDKCSACGFCISRCPADAIDIKGFR